MAHEHGSEYQVQIVYEDGTEELSGWMNSEKQVVQAMASVLSVHRPEVKAYWLQERNVLCPNCLDREQRIVEYPIANVTSPRYNPHNSSYLLAVGVKSRYELLDRDIRSVQ
jgi:hypothetical protein